MPGRLGEFRVIRKLSSGGMGIVLLAEQQSMGRQVALKIVRPEQLPFGDSRQRFEREATMIARLKHPGIVPVYAFGEERDIPFLAMEYVEGCTLAEALRKLPQTPAERLRGAHLLDVLADRGPLSDDVRTLCSGPWHRVCLRIVERVAIALDHAHRRGVVHRDVKPSNIMLAPDGRVMLLDFGLARAEGVDDLTLSGAQPGSLPYMAPEQVRGETPGTHTDVYALGVTLYELLALNLPFWHATSEELRRKILDARPIPLRTRNRALDRDTETVCSIAMDPTPSRRYPSAEALAGDLRNLLETRPIQARPAGASLRLYRFAQRRPAAAVAIIAVLLLAVGIPIAINLGIAGERDRAVRQSYAANVVAAGYALASRNSLAAQQHLEACAAELRGFEWHHLQRRCDQSVRHFPSLPGYRVAWIAGSDALAVSAYDRRLRVVRADDGRELWGTEAVAEWCISPDRTRLTTLEGNALRTVRARDGMEVLTFDPVERAGWLSVYYSGDGRTVVASGDRDSVRFDASSGRRVGEVFRLQNSRCLGVDHPGEGGAFIFWRPGQPSYDARTELHRFDAGGRALIELDYCADGAAFDAEGRRVVIGSESGGRIECFDWRTGARLWSVASHRGRRVASVRFAADGEHVVSAGTDSAIEVRSAADGRLVTTLLGHRARVVDADLSDDGTSIVSVSDYHDTRIWNWRASTHTSRVPLQEGPVVALAWMGPQRVVATGDRGTILEYDFGTNQVSRRQEADLRVSDATFDVARRRLVTVASDPTHGLRVWRLEGDAKSVAVPQPGYRHLAGDVVISADGARIATGSGSTVQVWDVEPTAHVHAFEIERGRVSALEFGVGEPLLWIGSSHGSLELRDFENGDVVLRLETNGPVRSLASHPSRSSVFVGEGHDVIERNARTGDVLRRLTAHQGWVHSIRFSPDGRRMVTASHDGSVRVWDADTGGDLLVLRGSGQWMYDACFSPDGARLAAVGEAGILNIWESVP